MISTNLDENKPLISVVIPSFNHGQWIGSAIDSIINQTYSNWEVIVVDNCSTDSTDYVLSKYKNNRVKILKVDNNGSIAFSRNVGLNLAKGEWIAFLDSDDFWAENKLEECSKYFTESTDFIYHDLSTILASEGNFQTGRIKSRKLKSPIFLDLLLKGNTISTSSSIVRAETIRKIDGMREDLNLIGVEDYNAWLRISRISEGFRHVKKTLGTYRIHDNNSSSLNNIGRILNATNEFSSILTSKQKEILKANLMYVSARQHLAAKDLRGVKQDLMQVIKTGSPSRKLRAILILFMMALSDDTEK